MTDLTDNWRFDKRLGPFHVWSIRASYEHSTDRFSVSVRWWRVGASVHLYLHRLWRRGPAEVSRVVVQTSYSWDLNPKVDRSNIRRHLGAKP